VRVVCGVWRVTCLMCPTLALYHAARRSPQAVITLIYAHGTLSPGSGAVGPSGETKADRLRRARAAVSGVRQTDRAAWETAATAAAQALGGRVSVVGRCRKVRWAVGRDHVNEQLWLAAPDTTAGAGDERPLRYRQAVGSFSNPNGGVNVRVLQWLRGRCESIAVRTDGAVGAHRMGRLLELYNGCGNHTVALAGLFDTVLAVEADPALTQAAATNYELNNADNVAQVTQTCEEFASSQAADAPVAFDVALVDPPRTGISDEALAVITAAQDILFLSCNQHRLAESLVSLAATHSVATVAYMDHFPFSVQSECGVHLIRRPGV
jgi:tRNA (uracil-5-)-methyltransferase